LSAITQKLSKEKKPSKTQQIIDKVKEKLDDGFEVKDSNSIDELRKNIIDELKISKNWRSCVRKIIGKELTNREISLSDKGFKVDAIEGINVNIEKPDPIEEPEPTQQNTAQQNITQQNTTQQNTTQQTQSTTPFPESKPASPHGTMPSDTSQEPTTPQPVLTSQQIESQKNFFKKIFSFAGDIYISMGLVQTDDEEEQKELEKPKPIKEFRAEMDGLADEMNQLMITYGMALPKYLDLIAFGLSAVMIMGVPLIKRVGFGEKKPEPKYEESLDEVKVKV